MRKLWVFLGLALVVLGVLPATAAAKPQDALLTPAQYFPPETPFYAAFRTDDAYLETLNGLLTNVGKQIPGGLPPNTSVNTLLDQLAGSLEPGSNFKTVFRSWLGDWAAVGLAGSVENMMSSPNPPILFAVSVTNKDAAAKFVGDLVKNYPKDYIQQKTVGNFTLWVPSADKTYLNIAFALGSDVLFISSQEQFLPLKPLDKNLMTADKFVGTINLLPADNYYILSYIDTPSISQAALAQMRRFQSGGPQEALQAMNDLLDAAYAAMGPQAIGITVLDGRTLTIDGAQLSGDKSKLEGLGFSLDYRAKPVNLSFAANIPADAPLVVQGTGLGTATLNGFKNFRALGDFVQKRGVLGALVEQNSGDKYAAKFVNDYVNISNFLTFGELAFSGMTGLNLEKDVLAWMDGDFASYVRVVPNQTMTVSLDTAVVIEATDPAAAHKVITTLDDALTQYRFPHTTENGVITMPFLRDLLAAGLKKDSFDVPEIDLLVGANDKVFAMGTRPGVEFSLNPKGASLADDPTYKAAQAFFLPQSEAIVYLNLKPLYPTLQALVKNPRDSAQLFTLLNMLESGSISAAKSDQGMVARFALTITQAQ